MEDSFQQLLVEVMEVMSEAEGGEISSRAPQRPSDGATGTQPQPAWGGAMGRLRSSTPPATEGAAAQDAASRSRSRQRKRNRDRNKQHVRRRHLPGPLPVWAPPPCAALPALPAAPRAGLRNPGRDGRCSRRPGAQCLGCGAWAAAPGLPC
jgi:hypothetical protein